MAAVGSIPVTLAIRWVGRAVVSPVRRSDYKQRVGVAVVCLVGLQEVLAAAVAV